MISIEQREAIGRLVSEITGEWVVDNGLPDKKKAWKELTDEGQELVEVMS